MTGTRISDLPVAALPLSGTEDIPLRAGAQTVRAAVEEVLWAARLLPVAQRADGTAANGNARGADATDLQTARLQPAAVASGQGSTISGGNNNTASGQEASVGGGASNAASGSRAAIGGGLANVADGVTAWVPGGDRASARGHTGRGAWASGRFSVNGDAQAGEFVLRALTSDATPARMTANGAAPSAANTVNLPNNGTYRIKMMVVAQQTGGTAGTAGDCASWELDCLVRRGANAAATAFVGGIAQAAGGTIVVMAAGGLLAAHLRDVAAGPWRVSVDADTTNGGVAITAIGEANKTIRWAARILSVEVAA